MVNQLSVISVLFATISGIWFVHCTPEALDGDDPGKPLFLTPYIEKGDVATARELARVPLFDNFNIESYAGYFTVNKTYDSNHFFWYFPSMSKNNSADPVMVWLQGGPGGPSVYGLFQENGPVRVRNQTFERRKVHWAQNNHIIYIDNPVGTGFSFTRHPDGYCTDETQIGEQLYSSLTQFFKLFPDLQKNEFFISGESYAGKYIPALGHTIHKKNPTADTKINLKGLLIGNGWTDPEHQLVMYSEYLYQIGLIDLNGKAVFEDYQAKGLNYIKNEQWLDAYNIMNSIILGEDSYFSNFTGFTFPYNYLYTRIDAYNTTNSGENFTPMMENNTVRKAIHVGNETFNDGTMVWLHLLQDMMKSVAPWMSELLDNYYCCIYSGQLDTIVPYPLTRNYLQHLNFTDSEQYKTAKRYIWHVEGEIAGYVTHAGHLIEVLVRNAGHMVPSDQPEWALDMVNRFTRSKNYWFN